MIEWFICAHVNDPVPAAGIVVVDFDGGAAVLLIDEDGDTDGEGGEEERGHGGVIEGCGDGSGVDGRAGRGEQLDQGG